MNNYNGLVLTAAAQIKDIEAEVSGSNGSPRIYPLFYTDLLLLPQPR